jgi:hypothetical protein
MGGNAIETDHVEVTSAYAARAPSNAPSACGKYSLYFILGFSAENDHFKVRDVGQLALSPNVLSRPDLLQPYLYRARNLVERFFDKIKQCRRVATRYDKLARYHLAFIKLASI